MKLNCYVRVFVADKTSRNLQIGIDNKNIILVFGFKENILCFVFELKN